MKISKESRKSDRIFANGLYTECAIATIFSKKPKIAKVVGDPVWERYQNRVKNGESIYKFTSNDKGPSIWLQRKIFIWTLNRYDMISCPSQGLANLLHKWRIKTKVFVIENGVPCISQVQIHQKYDVVSLSRLVKWKNIDILIRAASGSNLRLAIAGEGPEEFELRALAEECNVHAEFLGQVSQKSVPSLLASGKIFTLLSEYEGLSFSLIQAMMQQCSIIVSDAEGNTAVIQNGVNGLVVNPANLTEVRNSIDRLLNEPEFASGIAKEARRTAELKYCEEQQLKKMLNLFEEIGEEN
jgi:glycosyltransferase involved in cell wall biosynthesis